MSVNPIATASTAVSSAADRASDAALAKAIVKLAADKKAGAAGDVLRTDQRTVTQDQKAADKADVAAKANTSKVDVQA